MAVGPVEYTGTEANAHEIPLFKASLARHPPGAFADAFMTAPSPGIVAMAMKNQHYPTFDAYLAKVADALAVPVRAAARVDLIDHRAFPPRRIRHFTSAAQAA